MLIELTDGGVLDIISDAQSWDGCDTCDYGSSYVNYFNIELTTRQIKIEASQMYNYPLSEGIMMKLILGNIDTIKFMSEDEFTDWLKPALLEQVKDLEWSVSLRDFRLDYQIKEDNNV